MFNEWLLAMAFTDIDFNSNPFCSLKEKRRMATFNESLFKAFSDMVAAKLSIPQCEGLNCWGVTGTDLTS